MAKFKGTVFESTRMFCEEQLGTGSAEQVLAALNAADAELLRSTTALAWCPVEPVMRFHHEMDRIFGNGDLSLCTKAGRFSAGWAFNTVLKMYLRMRSPHWLVQRATSVWNRYHDTGSWQIEPPTKMPRIVGHLHDYGLRDPAFCARLRGWLTGAVELTGGQGAHVTEPRCVCRGHGHCMMVVNWEK